MRRAVVSRLRTPSREWVKRLRSKLRPNTSDNERLMRRAPVSRTRGRVIRAEIQLIWDSEMARSTGKTNAMHPEEVSKARKTCSSCSDHFCAIFNSHSVAMLSPTLSTALHRCRGAGCLIQEMHGEIPSARLCPPPSGGRALSCLVTAPAHAFVNPGDKSR